LLAGEPVEHAPTGVAPTVLDIAALAADIAEDLVLGAVRDVHGAVAVAARVQRVASRFLGGTAALPHRVHDEIADTVYTSISAGLTLSARLAHRRSRRALLRDRPEPARSPRRRRSQRHHRGPAPPRGPGPHLRHGSLREGDSDLLRLEGDVTALDPEATDTLVVFVHGLSEDEATWERTQRPRGGQIPVDQASLDQASVDQASVDQASVPREGRSYGECLKAQVWTPVYVRVNTGLSIDDHAFALAEVMDLWSRAGPSTYDASPSSDTPWAAWSCARPARSPGQRLPWTDRVSDVVCLGTPHLGAPLERAVDHGVRVLGVLP
jgi:hypothetical protein